MNISGACFCGTVAYEAEVDEQFGQLQPAFEIFCDSRVSWLPELEGTAKFARMPQRG